MNGPFDDGEAPTVVRRMSPRARTTLGGTDGGDEPTVMMRHQTVEPAADAPAQASSSSFQAIAGLVQQLEASPERVLVRAAAPLLLIVAQLRNSAQRADVPALRRQVVEEIDRFQEKAQKQAIEAGDIVAARYVLCATIDETVLMTPWGSRSEWSSNSLLNQYHNETWGGEKVFMILDRIKDNAARRLPLLLLIHACLMLGFEGRYRVMERGRDLLDDLRNEVSRLVRRYSEVNADLPLSREVQVQKEGRRMRGFIPLWTVAVAAVLLMFVVYAYATFMLSGAIQPVTQQINALSTGQGTR